eukprot:COSAG06_NODE_70064_length_194_cov_20.410526_1_plen_64_part_11
MFEPVATNHVLSKKWQRLCHFLFSYSTFPMCVPHLSNEGGQRLKLRRGLTRRVVRRLNRLALLA